MYLNLSEITKIQIDHTSRCNLACPQCARIVDGKTVNPSMPITDLTLDDYKILLEPFDEKHKVVLFHCGNYGDVLVSPTFDETFEYSINHPGVKKIRIATNGSARTPEWWANLAKLGGDRLNVIFSVDGLSDTNHIYRVGSNFEKIIENAQAFIDAGGIAEWAYIEFKHNYTQIEEAEALAKKMGFSKFTAKYTARFAEQDQKSLETRKGTVVEEKENQNTRDKIDIRKKFSSFDEYVENAPITCKYKRDKTVFVDMCMRLWPCCWMGAPKYFNAKTPQTASFEHFFSLYGEDFNDMRQHGWDVLNHEYYTDYLERSWDNRDDKFKRIYTCGRTCGDKFEFSSGHGKNIKSEELK